jgi:hypothetical protein
MRHGSTRFACLAFLALGLWPALGSAGEQYALTNARLGYRATPLLLLSRADVCADLALTPAQVESAGREILKIQDQVKSLKDRPNDAGTIRERRAIDEEALAWIDSRLTPDQKIRLEQLDLQWEGPSAIITRGHVSRTLHLSAEQTATMVTARQRRDAARLKGHEDADHILAEVALACLNKSQRETWLAMLGKPVEFRKH